MKKMTFIVSFFVFSIFSLSGQNNLAYLDRQGSVTQLIVDGKPFLVLGGELGNSSASSTDDIERIFPKLERMGLNTVLVPAYWDLIEPIEGTYNFSQIDKVISQAKEKDLKVIFLWFGAWKNSMSCYAPFWLKKDYKKYPRAYTKAGKPLEIASVFSDNVCEADNRAFRQLMKHVAGIDSDGHTVIMVQIENEIGMLEDARDYSKEANKLFNSPVPKSLLKYLDANRQKLHPRMLEKWGKNGFKNMGTWQEIFGNDVYTDEIFMTFYYAQYVEKLAQTVRSIYNIPIYVNAAMNSRGRNPGEYPSAGPLAHLIDVWHCCAPHIDMLAPDLYDKGFVNWVSQYKLHNNPLFIPEIRRSINNPVEALYVFGEHDAIGFSPFSIEDGSDSPQDLLVQGYLKIKELMPVITAYQGKGLMNGLLFDNETKERVLVHEDLKLTCRHYFTLPWDTRATDGSQWLEGGGIIIRLSKYEYLIAGNGIVVEFEKVGENEHVDSKKLGEDGFVCKGEDRVQKERIWRGNSRIGIGSVDEVKVNEDGTFKYIRRLNGDQTHQGRHVRISAGEFSVLHVTLYEYK